MGKNDNWRYAADSYNHAAAQKSAALRGDDREAPPSDVCWYERTPKTTYGNHITIVAAKLAIGILAFEVFLVAFLIWGIL